MCVITPVCWSRPSTPIGTPPDSMPMPSIRATCCSDGPGCVSGPERSRPPSGRRRSPAAGWPDDQTSRRVRPGPEPPPSPPSSGSDRSAPPRRCAWPDRRQRRRRRAAIAPRWRVHRGSSPGPAWCSAATTAWSTHNGRSSSSRRSVTSSARRTWPTTSVDTPTTRATGRRRWSGTPAARLPAGARGTSPMPRSPSPTRARCSSTRAGSTRPNPSCGTPPECCRVSRHLWGATFAEMHLGRLLIARRAFDRAEQLLRACVDENARMGSTASAYEASLHLGQCLVAAGTAGRSARRGRGSGGEDHGRPLHLRRRESARRGVRIA